MLSVVKLLQIREKFVLRAINDFKVRKNEDRNYKLQVIQDFAPLKNKKPC